MQLLLKATENNTDNVELGGGFRIPPVRAFIDDTTILSSKESATGKILSPMENQVIWCRIKFKHQRSRNLSLRKGKVNPHCGQRIPIVSEEPVKRLGRWFDESLKDINQAIETSRTLQGLCKIDRCPLHGKFKIRHLPHMLYSHMPYHNDTIIKTQEDFFRKIFTSHFIVRIRKGLLKVCMWEGVGDRT